MAPTLHRNTYTTELARTDTSTATVLCAFASSASEDARMCEEMPKYAVCDAVYAATVAAMVKQIDADAADCLR